MKAPNLTYNIYNTYPPNNNLLNQMVQNVQNIAPYINRNYNHQISNEEIEVVFRSSDSSINNIKIKCKINDYFYNVEEKLYQKCPQLRKTNNCFVADGLNVIRFQTLKDNKIKNGTNILLLETLKKGRDEINIFDSNNDNIKKSDNSKIKLCKSLNPKKTNYLDSNPAVETIVQIQYKKLTSALVGSSNPTFQIQGQVINKAKLNTILEVIKYTKPNDRALIRKIYNEQNKNKSYSKDNLIETLYIYLNYDHSLLFLVVGCFLPPYEYEAFVLYQIFRGSINFKDINSKYYIIAEIIGTKNPEELKQIISFYSLNYGKNLNEDIANNTSGDFSKILLAILQCKGSNSVVINDNRCKSDAEKLNNLGVGHWRANLEIIYNIFVLRSPSDLNRTYQYYKQLSGKGFISSITSEFSGPEQFLLNQVVHSKMHFYINYVELIHSHLFHSFLGLVIIICSRYALDLDHIKKYYLETYKINLEKDIDRLTIAPEIKEVIKSLVSNANKYY